MVIDCFMLRAAFWTLFFVTSILSVLVVVIPWWLLTKAKALIQMKVNTRAEPMVEASNGSALSGQFDTSSDNIGLNPASS